jgi:hypothetical protein
MTLKYSSPATAIKNYTDSQLAKSETNDCVVRAIAAASAWEYDKAHRFTAKEFKRENRKGTRFFNLIMCKLSNENKRLNRKKITTISSGKMKNGDRKMTVGSFVKQYDKGSYILTVRQHAFSIKNGEVVGGNKEDAIKLRCIVEGAWKVGTN